jgi:hypothetical protein
VSHRTVLEGFAIRRPTSLAQKAWLAFAIGVIVDGQSSAYARPVATALHAVAFSAHGCGAVLQVPILAALARTIEAAAVVAAVGFTVGGLHHGGGHTHISP